MIIGLNNLLKRRLLASDGEIGRVNDFYFDDFEWVVRYLVADTGEAGQGRQVLIATAALGEATQSEDVFRVNLNRGMVLSSPDVDTHKPVSRIEEERLSSYYGWMPYWNPGGALGMTSMAGMAIPVTGDEQRRLDEERERADPHLRSLSAVTGYRLAARDGHLGSVKDLLVNDQDWRVMYMKVDTGGLFGGREVLMAPSWVQKIDWNEKVFQVDLDKETIRSAPEYDPNQPLERDFEERLYGHYGRRGYWDDDKDDQGHTKL